MPFKTPIFGFRYPAITEDPNVPRDIKNLADDVENTVAALRSVALGIRGRTIYNTTGATGGQQEVMGDSVPFEFDPNRWYEFEWQGNIVATAANPYMSFTFRVANGSPSNTSPLVGTPYLIPVWGSGKFHYAQITAVAKGSELAASGLNAGPAQVRMGNYITGGNGGGTWTIRGDADNRRQMVVRDSGAVS
ncbi:hypothetical protein [Amycolatopsis echigonensis]|uniref:Uncharacterized protein n=1 Tax=Amycolatopsis echigonensis TaxID=2576905 RepID=A0A8E1VXW2_9PSEU|nr:hypothetical protein [Amycolatopsis echigonensis]MBB2500255.1 hypothetical protein [Amycolatopsis echigonensis]